EVQVAQHAGEDGEEGGGRLISAEPEAHLEHRGAEHLVLQFLGLTHLSLWSLWSRGAIGRRGEEVGRTASPVSAGGGRESGGRCGRGPTRNRNRSAAPNQTGTGAARQAGAPLSPRPLRRPSRGSCVAGGATTSSDGKSPGGGGLLPHS